MSVKNNSTDSKTNTKSGPQYYYNGSYHSNPNPNSVSASTSTNANQSSWTADPNLTYAIAAMNAFANAPTSGGVPVFYTLSNPSLTASQIAANNTVATAVYSGKIPPASPPSSNNSDYIPGPSYNGPYKFNAPMVNDAYFSILPTLSDNDLYGHVDVKSYNDAKQAWTVGSTGKVNAAKGAIQMDRQTYNTKLIAQVIKDSSSKSVDTSMSGFKFLYNPQTIQMQWGTSSALNSQALLYGLEKINPIAPNSTSSLVYFTLALNRIQDMSYINPDGSYSWESNPQYQQLQNSIPSNNPVKNKLITMSGVQKSINPYPETVSVSERKLIYEKGTMYDIEWLMKTLVGFSGLRDRNDALNGVTSDVGFIPPVPVELHLGNKLRYRVIVTDMSVNHIIFNSRMIPIWSTLDITAKRLPTFNSKDPFAGS